MGIRSAAHVVGLTAGVLLILWLVYDLATPKTRQELQALLAEMEAFPATGHPANEYLASLGNPDTNLLYDGPPIEPPDDTQHPDGYAISGTWHAQYSGMYHATDKICNGKPVYQFDRYAIVWHERTFRWFIALARTISATASCCDCGFEQAILRSHGGGCPESVDGPGCQGVWLERRVPDCIYEEEGGWCHQHKVRASASNGRGCKGQDCGHGTCVSLGNDYKCDCLYGWHGQKCQIDCSRGGCPVMTISGTHHPQYSGKYYLTNYICNNKPVHQNGEYVLYYDMANEWNVGPAARAKDCDVRAEPGSLYLGGTCYEDAPDGDMCKGSFWYEMDVAGCEQPSHTGWCPRQQISIKAATGERRRLIDL